MRGVHKDALFLSSLLVMLSLAFVTLHPYSGPTGLAMHQHQGFSVAESLSMNGRSVSVDDTAVYRTAYYALNGDVDWTPFQLSGNTFRDGWLTGSASFDIPSLSGEHYVIAYSCSLIGGGWDCHGGRWQLIVLDESLGGAATSWDFDSLAGGSLEDGAALVQDAERGSVLSPNGGVFRVPDSSSLDISDTISLSAWVKLDSVAGVGKIVVKPIDGGADPWEAYSLDVRDGNVRFIITDGSPFSEVDWPLLAFPISAGVWHHVAGTYDGSMMRLYLDGSMVNSKAVSISLVETGEDLLVGGYPLIGCCYLDGLVDDVALFGRALSQAEVLDLFGGEVPIGCSGSPTSSCSIANGAGQRSRTCDNNAWSDWGLCSVVSCNNGYHVSGNACVAEVNPDPEPDPDPVLVATSTCLDCGNGGSCSCTDDEYCYVEGGENICLLAVSGETYFVSPSGSDSGSGTSISGAWGTWQKGLNEAGAGDIVYFRGDENDVYYTTRTKRNMPRSGTESNPIRFFAYPGDRPILDGSQATGDNAYSGGIGGSGISNVHFKGLTVRNFPQLVYDARPEGFTCAHCDNMIYEECVAHDIGARGFYFYNPGDILFKNCDSYDNIDPLSDSPGNHGDGWLIWDQHSTSANLNSRVIFEGCRAWGNSDDAWDAESEGYIELNNCWAFDNGVPEFSYPGNGFKLGLSRVNTGKLERKVVNSIAAGNGGSGFTTNDNVASCSNCVAKDMNIFNNFAYDNGIAQVIFRTSSSTQQELRRVYRNNIAFSNGQIVLARGSYTHDHNSWDSSVSVSADDFMSLDIAQLYRPRKADGSLPDITFGKLKAGSDLIDAGVDVGLPYSGSRPDMGWYESSYGSPAPDPEPNPEPDLVDNEYFVEGQTFTNGNSYPRWSGVNIPRSVPTQLYFMNNVIESDNTEGFMLQCGDDSYSWGNYHNMDNAIISGNQFLWGGTPGDTITHGIMAGYSINYDIRYNFFSNPYYGVVWEGGTDQGVSMVNTAGGIHHNIMKNTRIAQAGFDGVFIYNNIFYSDIQVSQGGTPYFIRMNNNNQLANEVESKNIKIKNNIFYSVYDNYAVHLTEPENLIGFECDYNIYFWETTPGNEPRFHYLGDIISWDEWRALGYDEHSVIVDPNFIDTVNFVLANRLDYGTNLGASYQEGLSADATWSVGVSPRTALQDGQWQVGARIHD